MPVPEPPKSFAGRPLARLVRAALARASARAVCGALASLPGVAAAGPGGEQVLAGDATVTRPDAATTRIDQGSAKAILQWQSFSIAGDEYVQFRQPDARAIALNRVVGGEPSAILGRLEANGRVFLVNSSGIYFAPGATVDVNGLVASVLDLRDEDFLAGRYVFARAADAPEGAGVVNAGVIRAGEHGFVVLAGEHAVNSGVIEAPGGTAALAAGGRMTLALGDDGLVDVVVDAAAAGALTGVANVGELAADGGRVLLTAAVAEDLAATAVNSAGLVRARAVVERAGEVYLTGAGGEVVHAGVIDAAAAEGASAGTIEITSDRDVTIAAGSRIEADGDGAGDGGSVTVIADGHLAFREDASISAQGGAGGGAGGTVELSGGAGVAVRGTVRVGRGGTVLIDPAVLTIVGSGSTAAGAFPSTGSFNVGQHFIEGQLRAGADVILQANDLIKVSGGPFTIRALAGSGTTSSPGDGDLTLAIGDFTGTIDLTGVDIDIDGAVSITAGGSSGNVTVGNVTADQGVNIAAGAGNVTAGVLAADSFVNVFASGAITVGGIAMSGSASLVSAQLTASGAITVNGAVSVTNSAVNGRARFDVDGGTEAVTLNGPIAVQATGSGSLADATVDIRTFGGGIAVRQNVTATGANSADISFLVTGGAGAVTIGAPTARANLAAHGGTSSGSILIQTLGGGISVHGDLLAEGTSGSIFVSGGGDVTINGNVTAIGSTSSASVEIFAGGDITVTGDVTATAGGESASISISASGDIVINGNVATTATSSAEVDIRTFGGGSITIGGNVTARALVGFADASISISAFGGGDIEIFGNVLAHGASDASIEIATYGGAGGDITVHGDVTAIGSTSSAEISIAAYDGGKVVVEGRVQALTSGESAEIFIGTFGGAGGVTVNGDVVAAGLGGDLPSSASIFIETSGGGGITVNGNVRAAATSDAFIEFSADDGAGITVGGSVTASATSAFASASVAFDHFGGDVLVKGGVSVLAPGADARAVVRSSSSGGGGITITGPTVVTGGSEALAIFSASGGLVDLGTLTVTTGASFAELEADAAGITFRGPVRILDPGDAGGLGDLFVDVTNFARTTVTGLLEGNLFITGRGGGVVDINLTTRTPDAQVFAGDGSTGPVVDVALDNRGFAGAMQTDLLALGGRFRNVSVQTGGGLSVPSGLQAEAVRLAALGGRLDVPFLAAGTGMVPGAGDPALLAFMRGLGIRPPGPDPNVSLRAAGDMQVGQLQLANPYPYVRIALDGTLALGPVNLTGTDALVQLSALTPTHTIGVEQSADGKGQVNFNNLDHFARFPGTTVAVGSAQPGVVHSGSILVGQSGPIDLGGKNFICVSLGGCTGLTQIRTTGIVAELFAVVSAGLSFTPADLGVPAGGSQTSAREEERSEEVTVEGTGDEGAGRQLVSRQSGASERMCR